MKNIYFISIFIIIISILFFIMKFERRRPKAREIVMLAVLISLAVISRTVFFMAPQFKPMAAIIIIIGVALGPRAGFLSGALATFVSNIFFGQGPWTPWQMMAFGLIGFVAGILFHKTMGKKKPDKRDVIALCIYGIVSVIVIYGLIMDSATVIMYMNKPTKEALLVAYGTGLIYNVIHGGAVVMFLILLANPMLKKINRIKNKFGMFYDTTM